MELVFRRDLTKDELAELAHFAKKTCQTMGYFFKLDAKTLSPFSHNAREFCVLYERGKVRGFSVISGVEQPEITVVAVADFSALFVKSLQHIEEVGLAKKIVIATDSRDDISKTFIQKKEFDFYKTEKRMFLIKENFIPFYCDNLEVRAARYMDLLEVKTIDREVLGFFDVFVPHSNGTFVATLGVDMVAKMRVDVYENVCGIYGVAVRSEFRWKGIGKGMMSAVIQKLFDEGISEIYIEAEADNPTRLYKSLGFKTGAMFNHYKKTVNIL